MAIEIQSRTRGVLDALQIKPEETGRTGLLFVYLFLSSVVFTTGRTARDALFLSEFPSPARWLPYMWVAYGAASAAIVPLYSFLNDRFRRDIFNAAFSLFLAVTYVLSWLLVTRHWIPVFPILFVVAFGISRRLFPIPKNIAITYSSGMKNLPIAIGIAVMSFKGMVALPIAVGAAFQMLTAALFYRIFKKILGK